MDLINGFLEMCAGSIGLALFVMLFAANVSRAVRHAIGDDI